MSDMNSMLYRGVASTLFWIGAVLSAPGIALVAEAPWMEGRE